MSRRVYPTDLSDADGPFWSAWCRRPNLGDAPAKYSRREIINAIRYVLRTGCAWRLLPHDLPPWQLAYHYFWAWRLQGTWQQIHDALHIRVRQAAGREPTPSAAIIDSQSVQTTQVRSQLRAFLSRLGRYRNGFAVVP
jgi:putative transposase